MPTLTIRNVEPEIHAALRQKAAENGHSMEAEARQLLKANLAPNQESMLELVMDIHNRLKGYPELAEFLDREQAPLPDPTISFDE